MGEPQIVMKSKKIWQVIWLLVTAIPLQAAEVIFDVIPLNGVPGDTIIVKPCDEVSFLIEVIIVPDTPFSREIGGLAAFDLDLLTNLLTLQQRLTAFDPLIEDAFPENQSLGTPTGDDILGISGAQNPPPNPIIQEIAVHNPQPIATGTLITPNKEGIFNITLTGSAELFTPVTGFILPPTSTSFDPGFTILTRKVHDKELRCDCDTPHHDYGCAPMSPVILLGTLLLLLLQKVILASKDRN